MTQFEIWKLVTDFGLFGSLIYFAYRFLNNQNPVNNHQLEELQGGLRNAIREADQAGKGLNEQLIHRKQNLEKLLFELETVESRVNRAINNAEQSKSNLESQINRIQDINSDITTSNDEFSSAVKPSFRTNIFGEPLDDIGNITTNNSDIDLKKAFANTPLTKKIEKEADEVTKLNVKQTSQELSMEEVYAKAEDLLKAGKAIEEVSKETQLTTEEVRLLSQMLENDMLLEKADTQASEKDERLGVLAGLKRQVQVL